MYKKTGQNFLIDKNIALREVDYANISKNDVVLEIGPGKGILTNLLAEKAKKVIAVEIDKNLFDYLKKSSPSNVELINADILKLDFGDLSRFNKIVSNLPFQISSPITFKFIDSDFSIAVLIYQKEFAERMVAKEGSKNYSRLTVGVYYRAICEYLETVSKKCFSPIPKVDSSIIRLKPREEPPFSIYDENFFFNLTKNLFNHRRKKIKTTINELYNIKDENIPYQNNRIQDLTPKQIGNLSNILFKLLKE
jgi:16S rRNA (adenine1518-N6/adenine1519-N6)-dimethyltransferase